MVVNNFVVTEEKALNDNEVKEKFQHYEYICIYFLRK